MVQFNLKFLIFTSLHIRQCNELLTRPNIPPGMLQWMTVNKPGPRTCEFVLRNHQVPRPGTTSQHTLVYPATVWETQRPSGAPPSPRLWSQSAKVLIRTTGQEEFHARYLRDRQSATHRTLTAETNRWPTGDLAGPEAQCITVAQLTMGLSPPLASSFTVSDGTSLWCVVTAQATTRQHSIFSFAVRPSCRPTLPILNVWGLSWSWSRQWHPPPPDWKWVIYPCIPLPV